MHPHAETAGIVAHLSAHAADYFPDLERHATTVRTIDVLRREASTLCVFALESPGSAHRVAVKVPLHRAPGGQPPAADPRPRLTQPTDAATKLALEHRAMGAIERVLRRANDRRLGAVRILDRLAGENALVMEAVEAPTLVDLTRRRARPFDRGSLQPLLNAYRNTGRWLAAFHDIPVPDDTPALRTRGSEVLELVGSYVDHLAGEGVDSGVLRPVMELAVRGDDELFPASYDIAWSHGDAAPRNVFVGPTERITGFDVLGRWRAPIQEDLAYFVTSLQTHRLNVLSQGSVGHLVPHDRLERAFLQGYGFSAPSEFRQVRAFQLLLLLDRWTSFRSRSSAGVPSLSMAYVRLTDRFFAMSLEAALRDLEDGRGARTIRGLAIRTTRIADRCPE